MLRKNLLLFWLLCKRLYKKASFVALILLLAAITAFMYFGLKNESSMIRVGIVAPKGSVQAEKIITDLTADSGAAKYTVYEESKAQELLESAQIDAVWQFAENFDTALLDFFSGRTKQRPIVITVREKNVFLNLTAERLYAELYPVISREFYASYAFENVDGVNRKALDAYYDRVPKTEGIVNFEYYNDSARVEDTNYLLTPLRGMLAVILNLCSISCALFFLSDAEVGVLDSTPIAKRYSRLLMYGFSGTVNIALFIIAALIFSRLFGNTLTELVCMLIFVIASVGFASLISGIAGKTVRLAAVMPIVVIATLALCPIFLNTNIPFLSWIFPTFWYLISVYNKTQIPYMCLYTVAVYLLSFIVWRTKKYVK